MAIGLHGQSGRLVLSHVEEECPKTEIVHVPTHRLSMEVPIVVVMQKKCGNVETFHVQVSVWQKQTIECIERPCASGHITLCLYYNFVCVCCMCACVHACMCACMCDEKAICHYFILKTKTTYSFTILIYSFTCFSFFVFVCTICASCGLYFTLFCRCLNYIKHN